MKIGGYYIKSNLVYIISVFLAFKLSCATKVDKLLGVPDESKKKKYIFIFLNILI